MRRVTIAEALIDTGATTLSLPAGVIERLGLKKRAAKRVSTSTGESTASLYDAVRLTIQDRQCTVDVMKVPDNVSVLIGQVPLELLDLVIDPRSRTLVGKPAHGGEHVFEMYCFVSRGDPHDAQTAATGSRTGRLTPGRSPGRLARRSRH